MRNIVREAIDAYLPTGAPEFGRALFETKNLIGSDVKSVNVVEDAAAGMRFCFIVDVNALGKTRKEVQHAPEKLRPSDN